MPQQQPAHSRQVRRITIALDKMKLSLQQLTAPGANLLHHPPLLMLTLPPITPGTTTTGKRYHRLRPLATGEKPAVPRLLLKITTIKRHAEMEMHFRAAKVHEETPSIVIFVVS